jgi:hypothetical protein
MALTGHQYGDWNYDFIKAAKKSTSNHSREIEFRCNHQLRYIGLAKMQMGWLK